MGLAEQGAPVDRFTRRAKAAIRGIRPMPLMAVALAAFLLSMSTFAVLNFTDFTESRPSGLVDAPSEDGSGFRVMGGGLVDSDASGVPASLQNFIYGTDPEKWNTAGTPLPDGWLIEYGLDALDPGIDLQPAARPPEHVLPGAYGNQWPGRFTPTLGEVYSWERPGDWDEAVDGPWFNGLDPRKWDNSGDGIPDGWLLYYELDPLEEGIGQKHLAGGEGLSVLEAFTYNTNPHLVDTAGSGLSDREEIEGPLNPRYPQRGPERFPPTDPTKFSTTGSGVCDGYLVAHGLDPTDPGNAYGDLALSGASTLQKFNYSYERFGDEACSAGAGLDPLVQSSVGGLIPDGWLLRYGLDPLDEGIEGVVTQSTEQIQQEQQAWDHMLEAPDMPALEHVELTVLDEYEFGRPSDWDEATMGPWWGGTDPSVLDTDGDGLPDAVELRGFYIGVATDVGPNAQVAFHHVSSDPTRVSTSGDALTDWEEIVELGTDPTKRDTSLDGIADVRYLDEEFQQYGLDPRKADSAGDYLRDGVRLEYLLERSAQALEEDWTYPWDWPHQDEGPRDLTRRDAWFRSDWSGDCMPDGVAAVFGDQDQISRQQLAQLLGPMGDVDGDGVPNIVDPVMSGDGLRNGWQVEPSLYSTSEFAPRDGEPSRSETDPLNPCTDGTGLRDEWQIEFGRPHPEGGWELDPSDWQSIHRGGESDADVNLADNDARWVFFDGSGPVERVFPYPNRLEQQYGTDPYLFDSDGDGLGDGWKVFWGIVYPGDEELYGEIYPGSPGDFDISGLETPALGVEQSEVVLAQQDYTRFIVKPEGQYLLEGEAVVEEHVFTVEGGEQDVLEVTGTLEYGFLEVQKLRANPYMASTSDDGIPDWWKYLYWFHLPHAATPSEAGCVDARDVSLGPFNPDLPEEPLNEGLPVEMAYAHGTNPFCKDTLMDGFTDLWVVEEGLDPLSRPPGLTVFEQITGDAQTDGTGLLNRDQLTIHGTDPLNPDTSGSGLLDGENVDLDPQAPKDKKWIDLYLDLGISYRKNPDETYTFRGELSHDGDQLEAYGPGGKIPKGWLVSHDVEPTANLDDLWYCYSLGMPAWWQHGVHGPWWGGIPAGSCAGVVEDIRNRHTDDWDNDGLKDFDGDAGYEDPMPFANWHSQWRLLPSPWDDFYANATELRLEEPDPGSHPADEALGPLVRRLMAQSFLNPREAGEEFVSVDRSLVPPEMKEVCLRPQGHVVGESKAWQLYPSAGAEEPLAVRQIMKGEPVFVKGSVHDCETDEGLHGVTVEARFLDLGESFGAAFTNTTGNFTLPVVIDSNQSVPLPDDVPVVLRGCTANAGNPVWGCDPGFVNWTADPTQVDPGQGDRLVVRTYASPDAAPYNESRPPLKSNATDFSVIVRSGSVLILDAPDTVRTGGSDFDVSFRLTDSVGAPLQDPVEFLWMGEVKKTVTPDSEGEGDFRLPAPHAKAGPQELVATSHPVSGFVAPIEEERVTIRLQNPVEIELDVPSSVDAGQTLPVKGRVSFEGEGVAGIRLDLRFTDGGRDVESESLETGSDGSFATSFILGKAERHGNYLLIATAQATDHTERVSTPAQLIVRSLPRFTDVSTGNIAQGDPVEITGRLVEPDGSSIAGTDVLVQLHDEEALVTTDGQGRFSTEFSPRLPIQPVLQMLRFEGDDMRVAVTDRVERPVVASTQLSMASGTLARGGDLELPVHLADADGNPVEGARVHVTWGGEPAVSLMTDSNGRAVFHRAGAASDPLGTVVVRAQFAGSQDKALNETSVEAVWTVITKAEIVLPEGVFEAGTPIPQAVLRDAGTLEPIARASVTFKADRSGPHSVQTDGDGRFAVVEGINRTSPPVTLNLEAHYGGNESYDPVDAASTVVIRTPVEMETRLPTNLVMGREALVPVQVVGLDGNPVPDGRVNVTLGDQDIGVAEVENGVARVSIIIPENASSGPASLRFSFEESSLYAPAVVEGQTNLLRSVTLTFIIEESLPGQTSVVRVRAESGGEPVAFIPIHLQVEGVEGGLLGETNEQGIATFQVKQPVAGAQMAARFPGQDQFHPTHAMGTLGSVAEVGPLERGTILFAWIAVAVGIVLTGLLPVLYRLRMSPLAPAMRRAHRILGVQGPDAKRILLAYEALEDAAIGEGILAHAATTARVLQEAVEPHVPTSARFALDRLIGLFELARYGTDPIGSTQRDDALAALDEILASMRKEAGFAFPWPFRSRKKMGVAV